MLLWYYCLWSWHQCSALLLLHELILLHGLWKVVWYAWAVSKIRRSFEPGVTHKRWFAKLKSKVASSSVGGSCSGTGINYSCTDYHLSFICSVSTLHCVPEKRSHFNFPDNFYFLNNFWSTLFRNSFCMIWFITYSPLVWDLYLPWCKTTSAKLLCTLRTMHGHQTLCHLTSELDHRHNCCRYQTVATPSQCEWHVCESSKGIFWPTFALNLHIALRSIC